MAFGQPSFYPQYPQSYSASYMNPYMQTYGYNNYQQPQPQTQQMQQQQPIAQTQPQMPVINGKIVDGEDAVKSFDVPIGSIFIFPKADGSCIFTKSWNADGTTKVTSYVKVDNTTTDPTKDTKTLNDIYESISSLEKKFDEFIQ